MEYTYLFRGNSYPVINENTQYFDKNLWFKILYVLAQVKNEI